MTTHYVPYFTIKQDDTHGYAVCGAMVDIAAEHSSEPTCPGCRAYVEAEAAQPERSADDLFGTFDPATAVPSDYDSLNTYGASERFQKGVR